jgi:hypothetical protein
MDTASGPDDARRAHRLRIGIRVLLYALALALITLAWQRYHGDSSKVVALDVARWTGVTSQGRVTQAMTTNLRLTSFSADVETQCANGSVFTLHWDPGQRHLAQHGEHVRGRHAGTGRTDSAEPMAFDIRIWARTGNRPHGTIDAEVQLTTPSGTLRCDSGAVTFALRRSP